MCLRRALLGSTKVTGHGLTTHSVNARKGAAAYVERNHPKSREIAEGDETREGDSSLTQHLQGDHAIVSSPVFHDKENGKEHEGHCEQKDDSPIGPRVYSSRPLQGKDQTHRHWYLYAEAFQVEALQSSLAVEMCIFGSTEMIDAEEYYNNDSDAQRDDDVEADSPRRGMSYSPADQGTKGQGGTFYAAANCKKNGPALE